MDTLLSGRPRGVGTNKRRKPVLRPDFINRAGGIYNIFRTAVLRLQGRCEYKMVLVVESETMTDPEKWKELCAQAAVEKDPKRLLELVQEINRILDDQDNKNRPDRTQ